MTAEQTGFLTALYLKKRPFLIEYADALLHNYALSEEAVQQTFEIACQKIDDLCSNPNPEGWLTRVLAFVIRNAVRRQRAESDVIAFTADYRPDLAPAPITPLPLHITYGNLVNTPQFQLIYELEVMGLTLAEIAEEEGISLNVCKKRAERARKHLQKKLYNFKK